MTTVSVEKVVKDRYSLGAEMRVAELCCPTDYDPQYLEVIPEEVLDRDYGCGDPSRYLKAGETVLDLGSGTGRGIIKAAHKCIQGNPKLKESIRSGEISEWPGVHDAYREIDDSYEEKKRVHARIVLIENLAEGKGASMDSSDLLDEALETASFILDGIHESRKKDYENHFRNITFDSDAERDAVIGSYEENAFIHDAEREYENFRKIIHDTGHHTGDQSKNLDAST